MSSTSPAEGPYTAEPSVIKEGMFQVRNAEGEPVMTICGLDEARDRASALNSAYLAGQASREQQWIPVSELQVGERYVVQEAGGHAFVGTYTGGRFEFTMDGSNYVRQVAHSQRITILP